MITTSLNATKAALGAAPAANWLSGFYQYANRLAHLRFLRDRGVNARLAFVYFVRDPNMNGPQASLEWKQYLAAVYCALGFRDGTRVDGVGNIFIDVGVVPPRAEI